MEKRWKIFLYIVCIIIIIIIAIVISFTMRCDTQINYTEELLKTLPSKTAKQLGKKVVSTLSALRPTHLYRLGDAVRGGLSGPNGLGRNGEQNLRDYYKTNYKNSIASDYIIQSKGRSNDIKLLHKICQQHKTGVVSRDAINKNTNGIIIHLRVGDVIDNRPYTVDEFLAEARGHRDGDKEVAAARGHRDGDEEVAAARGHRDGPKKFIGRNYVKPLSYYRKIEKQTNRLVRKNKVKNSITIVAGYHTGGSHLKSEDYIKKIQAFFENSGYNVSTRINKDADDDFIYCSDGEYYVPSGGGFSALISDLVKYNGHKVITASN